LSCALALLAVALLFEGALRVAVLTDAWDLPHARSAALYADRAGAIRSTTSSTSA
jgi:hypothetical protein